MTISKLFTYFYIILILMLIGSIVKSGIRSIDAETRLTDVERKVDGLEQQQQILQQGVARSTSLEFIERQIRDQLKLVKPGETMVVLPDVLGETDDDPIQYSYKEVGEEEIVGTEIWKEWVAVFK